MKLIACYLAGNCEKYIDMSLEAVHKYVDEILIILDSTSKDNTERIVYKWKEKLNNKLTILERDYEHSKDVKNSNSNARNYYLEYLQENYNNDFCLVLDSDEVVDENIKLLKPFLEKLDKTKNYLISPKMIHFIGDLGHEDATKNEHYCPNRLFRINKNLVYPNSEHPVLMIENDFAECFYLNLFTIYHLAYILPMFFLKERYTNNLDKSNIHSPQFLREWYYAHITGRYPRKDIDITTIPKVIKEEFLIDEDFFYFLNRQQLEVKHFIDSKAMIDLFKLDKDSKVLFVGDGMGMRTYAMSLFGIDARGFDISKYAVENSSFAKYLGEKYYIDDIVSDMFKVSKFYDVVICYDVLEHLEYNELNRALKNIKTMCKKDVLFSIPFIGDPNLLADYTHKIKENKDWWIKHIEENGIKIKETPEGFPYKDQILVGEIQ